MLIVLLASINLKLLPHSIIELTLQHTLLELEEALIDLKCLPRLKFIHLIAPLSWKNTMPKAKKLNKYRKKNHRKLMEISNYFILKVQNQLFHQWMMNNSSELSNERITDKKN